MPSPLQIFLLPYSLSSIASTLFSFLPFGISDTRALDHFILPNDSILFFSFLFSFGVSIWVISIELFSSSLSLSCVNSVWALKDILHLLPWVFFVCLFDSNSPSSCMLTIILLELLNINHSYFLSDSNNIQVISKFYYVDNLSLNNELIFLAFLSLVIFGWVLDIMFRIRDWGKYYLCLKMNMPFCYPRPFVWDWVNLVRSWGGFEFYYSYGPLQCTTSFNYF